jgi:hypothetical protein
MRIVYLSLNCLSRKKSFYQMKIVDTTEKLRYQWQAASLLANPG